MAENLPTTGDDINANVRHEKSDAYVRGIFWFAGITLVAGVVIQVAMAFLVFGMNAAQVAQERPTPPIIAKERAEASKHFIPSLDPEQRRQRTEAESGRREVQPRLQSDPADDLKIMRAWEEKELRKGRLPLPNGWPPRRRIEKAMSMLADPATARSLGVGSRKDIGKNHPSDGRER
jgi:hypothetical protein